MASRGIRVAGTAASAVVFMMGLSTNVSAAETPDTLQQQINHVLASTEGGAQISRYEIAWNGGEAVMAFPLPGELYAPPSSPAAIKLEAKFAGVPKAETAEAVAKASAAADDNSGELPGIPAPEDIPTDEADPGVTTRATADCPTQTIGNDWYYFYQFKEYAGRRLSWNAKHTDYMYFSAYDFVNRTSSWSNKGGKTIYVRGRTESGNDASCNQYSNNGWNEAAHTSSAALSAKLDNTADCFWTS
ncbi:peptidase inhibitor family I36 protein [Streptomyces hirsutus]|uniref:peptidase inhibitor family I36 protein n=1 Tax=Streptomyces hirsutus TaxID=35620 RepID=UPI003F4C0717